MKEIGAAVLVRTVKGLAEGTLKETSQENAQFATNNTHNGLKHAPKIFTETCKIDFSKSVQEVHNLIRGLSPFPGAFTYLDEKMLKIFRSEKEANDLNEKNFPQPGSYKTDGKSFLKFACADGFIRVRELQLEGKKKINIEDFLRGYRFEPGGYS